ncbi:MAG: HAMP domain-containing sensor histidine kinase [Candidatus Cloacimonadota bacterium]|nr:HAMP domain-containing sensor histidine kinase [Candidatus Cloacimonadota bacterium]
MKNQGFKAVTAYVFIGGMLMVIIFTIFNMSVLQKVRDDVKVIPNLYAKNIGAPTNVDVEQYLGQYVREEILTNINFPMIFTNAQKIPASWENIGIEKKEFSQLNADQQENILQKIEKMESHENVIPLKLKPSDPTVYGYVFYGETKAIKYLRIIPYFQIPLIILFILIGFLGYMNIRKAEKRYLWIGLAKETAHQFGTPISSLLAWIDILEAKLPSTELEKVKEELKNMKSDVEKLKLIASRFGKVGSSISHKEVELHKIIAETVANFQRLVPKVSNKINLHFKSKIEGKKYKLDPDLLKWTMENMIKNSLDAMRNKAGEIVITAYEKGSCVHIQIKDEGLGMPRSMYKKAFQPGVTNKQRGWGLGLSLAKRIVEEYHRGKIHVVQSEPDKGTTFEIILPIG